MSGNDNREAFRALSESFDDGSNSIRTTITNADVDINVSAFTDSIAIADTSGNKVTTTAVGGKRALDVNVTDITIDHVNDSIRVGDGTNLVTTTTSGLKTALDVNINGGSMVATPAGATVLIYASNSVAVAATSTILSYTVVAGVYVQKIYLSGSSIGAFNIKKNGSTIMVYRMSQTQFSAVLDLATATAWGLQASVGDIISVEATNAGTSVALFDVTLQNLQT